MLDSTRINDILFLDIETVSQYPTYSEMAEREKILWEKKAQYFLSEGQEPADVYDRSALYAEFGKVICISVGLVFAKNGVRCFRLKSFCGDDEKLVLSEFGSMLENYSNRREVLLCAHNGKEFDFPFVARRFVKQGIRLPEILDIAGKKPWDISHLDTMELWKFGEYRHYTSLDLLAYVLGISSPKEDMDGAMVSHIYYKDHNLDRIARYCEMDVLTIAQIISRFKGVPLIEKENVEFSTGA
jgi:predicted PolB exonuclease-like 3'-5' exonuclease